MSVSERNAANLHSEVFAQIGNPHSEVSEKRSFSGSLPHSETPKVEKDNSHKKRRTMALVESSMGGIFKPSPRIDFP